MIARCDRGSESRTDEKIQKLASICHACEHFDGIKLSCSQCGCQKVRSNLLIERWKSGSCPLGKWPIMRANDQESTMVALNM